jgi:hypothetical protein
MERFDIINHLISVNNYKSFLEIGTQNQINFSNVNIDHKVCVDPDPESNPTYLMTSDEFFKINKSKFDIVFIDELHHADFVYRDIINSLSTKFVVLPTLILMLVVFIQLIWCLLYYFWF